MVYTPVRVIEKIHHTLRESTDLSKPLSQYLGRDVYLVLQTEVGALQVIDLLAPLTFESGITVTLPLTTVYASKLSDSFVARYKRDHIPIRNSQGQYTRGLKVYNPVAYKDVKVQFTSMNTPSIVDEPTMKGYLDDLVVSSVHMDFTHTLAAVNGVFHRTSLFEGKLYIHDGFRTMRVTGNQDVTLVDSSELGGHSIIPLTPSNVVLDTYNGAARITPGISLSGKTVFLVIDGYFYHMDAVPIWASSDTVLKVETARMPLVEQLRHNPRTLQVKDRYGEGSSQSSRKYTDAYDTKYLNQRSVSQSVFATRDFQYSRLTHYHSFLVVFDTPYMYQNELALMALDTPQMYAHFSKSALSGMLDYHVGLAPSFLISQDGYDRKHVFISGQDNDVGYHRTSQTPSVIPNLMTQPTQAANLFARFVDYTRA